MEELMDPDDLPPNYIFCLSESDVKYLRPAKQHGPRTYVTLQAPSILNLPVMVSDIHPRSFHPEWALNMDVLLPNSWYDADESLSAEVSNFAP